MAVLRPMNPTPMVFNPWSGPVRRAGSVSSGSQTPQPRYPGVRVLPPSGSSTPQPGMLDTETCPSCGNAYMPDAIFCRHCGQKRQVEIYSAFSGPVSPAHGVYVNDPPLYSTTFSGPGTAYAGEASVYNALYSGSVSPAAGTTVYANEAAPVYNATYSGSVTPVAGGTTVYANEAAPVYNATYSGSVTPVAGGTTVYANEAAPVYNATYSGSVTPVAGGATALASGPAVPVFPAAYSGSAICRVGATANAPCGGLRARGILEPTAYAAPSVSIPVSSCEVPPATAGLSASNGCTSMRLSSYTPLPMQATAHSLPGTVTPVPPVTPVPMPRASVGSLSVSSLPTSALAADIPTPVEPQLPASLTAGLPDPSSIERQKSSYARGLEEQLRHGTDVLAQQLKQQSDYLFAMGDQRKRQYALQVDQEIKQREMELAQQHNEQLLLLQQAAQQQKSALEHQANALLLEYNQKKAQEDLAYQQYQFQKRQYETQLQYNEEMKELQVQQNAAEQQVAHQRAYIAQQAVQATQQAAVTARQVRLSGPPGAPATYAAPFVPVPCTPPVPAQRKLNATSDLRGSRLPCLDPTLASCPTQTMSGPGLPRLPA
ncbi:unnamed protein product [Effrenium voratum]|uniref:Uncharacterized protein n=1 Tax=Effrenium voratum TaxID=2562239 RepID=A0AA36NND6_9DINO|nr:unnamed protein product [Effrenium voratum]